MILLGAESLSDALDTIAIVNRASSRDAQLISQIQAGVKRSAEAAAVLCDPSSGSQRPCRGSAEERRLTAARAAKVSLLTALRAEEHLAARRLKQLEAAARRPAGRGIGSSTIADARTPPRRRVEPAAAPAAPVAAAGAARAAIGAHWAQSAAGDTLTVVSTAYAIHGTTATGIRAHGAASAPPTRG